MDLRSVQICGSLQRFCLGYTVLVDVVQDVTFLHVKCLGFAKLAETSFRVETTRGPPCSAGAAVLWGYTQVCFI